MRASPLCLVSRDRRPCGDSRPGGNRTPNRRFWRPVLYQLSYGPVASEWPGAELNRRHRDFQSRALPTELPGLGLRGTRRQKTDRSDPATDPEGPLPTAWPACAGHRSPKATARSALWRRVRWSHSGGGIRTRDLRVMSPTSYQTAPPRNENLKMGKVGRGVNPPRGPGPEGQPPKAPRGGPYRRTTGELASRPKTQPCTSRSGPCHAIGTGRFLHGRAGSGPSGVEEVGTHTGSSTVAQGRAERAGLQVGPAGLPSDAWRHVPRPDPRGAPRDGRETFPGGGGELGGRS